jgi:hypothetical protein
MCTPINDTLDKVEEVVLYGLPTVKSGRNSSVIGKALSTFGFKD